MTQLSNGIISIAVKEHGAELSSIKKDGREYLWQADPEFWGRHSPVLFPIVGSVWQKTFRSHGKEYNMGQHGLARDLDFKLKSVSEDEVWYCLESSPDSLEKYPYEFILEIGYRIEGSSIKVMWKVQGRGNEAMAFQIGAHPAFHWPLLSDEAIAQGTGAMKKELSATKQRGWFRLAAMATEIVASQIKEAGCIDPCIKNTHKLDDGYMPLDTESFNNDALIFEDSQVNSVTLCKQDKTPYLTLTFDAPVVGLWSCPGKNAPFVCIEPWYGRTDDVQYSGMFEDRKWMQKLAPGEEFNGSYTIEIH